MGACSVSYDRLQEIVRQGVSDTLFQYQWRPPVVIRLPNSRNFSSLLDSQSQSVLKILREDLKLLHGSRSSSRQPASFSYGNAHPDSEHPAAEHSERDPSPTPSIVITRTRKVPTTARARKRRTEPPSKNPTASETNSPDPVATPLKEESPTTSRPQDPTGKKHGSLADAPPLSTTEQHFPSKPRQRPTAADFFTPPPTTEDGKLLPEESPAAYSSADIERLVEEEKLSALRHQAIQATVYQSQPPLQPPTVSTNTTSFRAPSTESSATSTNPDPALREEKHARRSRSKAQNASSTMSQMTAVESSNQL
ncbi:MAG: hypothetical protein Q9188_006929, partial [Gyalolechia gomerana]